MSSCCLTPRATIGYPIWRRGLPRPDQGVGFRADPRNPVTLTADQVASFDFALQKGVVRWNEISQYQARQLFPPARGKDLIFSQCNICHQFQSRMASVTRDAEGGETALHTCGKPCISAFSSPHFSDQDAADVASYLTSLFGPDSVLPNSPADVTGYKETLRLSVAMP